jgi:hypothetical protein
VASDNCEGKLECVHDAFASSGRDVDILTPVVMRFWAQIISVLAVGFPSTALSRILVCNDFASQWSKSCFVVIHQAMKVRCSG